MARYGKEHKQATRRRIIEAAGRRLKRDGIDGSGIATLMADAGLTNGAFYAHFESKEDLVANALVEQLREQRESFSAQPPGRAGLEQIVRAVSFGSAPRQPRGRLPIRRPARRDRALHGRNQARVHRRRAGRDRRHRRAPGARRSAVGTREDAERVRSDGRDAPALPRPGRPTARRRGPRAGHPERPRTTARRRASELIAPHPACEAPWELLDARMADRLGGPE